jgi:hypothetical protein
MLKQVHAAISGWNTHAAAAGASVGLDRRNPKPSPAGPSTFKDSPGGLERPLSNETQETKFPQWHNYCFVF